MKVIYIAGKFRGETWWDVRRNVLDAEQAALAIWKLGAAVICPHLNTANFDKVLPDEIFLAGNMEILRRCDAVFLLPTWKESRGATAEYGEACRLGLPCFEDVEQLRKWMG